MIKTRKAFRSNEGLSKLVADAVKYCVIYMCVLNRVCFFNLKLTSELLLVFFLVVVADAA